MNIQQNKDLTDFNTFRVKVTADYFVEVTTEKELEDAIDFTIVEKLPFQILGGGSNVLFVRNFQGMIIFLRVKLMIELVVLQFRISGLMGSKSKT